MFDKLTTGERAKLHDTIYQAYTKGNKLERYLYDRFTIADNELGSMLTEFIDLLYSIPA